MRDVERRRREVEREQDEARTHEAELGRLRGKLGSKEIELAKALRELDQIRRRLGAGHTAAEPAEPPPESPAE